MPMPLDKVLIIEDEAVVRNILNELFQRRKCAAVSATTLVEAEAAISRESFDLILLDIRMPDGDGQKFLERLALLPERPLALRNQSGRASPLSGTQQLTQS